MKIKEIDLCGTWKFRCHNSCNADLPEIYNTERWLEGTVPGTVHTDLMNNSVIPDPYHRMNENKVQWTDAVRWEYVREFTVDESLLKHKHIEMIAEGLDTFATVYINDKEVGKTDNMFTEFRFDIKPYLIAGKNLIRILFDSPELVAENLEKENGKLTVALEPRRVYVRKAQYSFGWDWGPKLTTSGIWKPIRIEAYSELRLAHPFIKVTSLTDDRAVCDCTVEVTNGSTDGYQLYVDIKGENFKIEQELQPDGNIFSSELVVTDPALWWPNGYGAQPLYKASFRLIKNGTPVDEVSTIFGIRTVRLIRDDDTEGENFILEVNGEKIFCKGANWIPADNFIPRIPDDRYEQLITMAKDAHMNMVRVWGGGIYENKKFYELCDSLGLMIWQDFMFACGEYPEEEWFMKNVEKEANHIIKLLRNHPAIVLWCGNNECEYLFCNEYPEKHPDEMRGTPIFRDLLSDICNRLDDSRPYWRSSPFGSNGHPNDQTNGNHHQWEVWSNWKDYGEYSSIYARFVTEFGFQSPANRKTFDDVTETSDRDFNSPVMIHHNKQVKGTERLIYFQEEYYNSTKDFETFIYQGQLLQSDALTLAVEHWRRRKFDTAGAIFWQLNDCWPVSSWSVIDSALRPKASYYAAKRFFAPVLLSVAQSSNSYSVWLTNDTLQPVKGDVIIELVDLSGKKHNIATDSCEIAKNSSSPIRELERRIFDNILRESTYLRVRLLNNGKIAAENRTFFCRPKELTLSDPKIDFNIEQIGAEKYLVKLQSDVFVKSLFLEDCGDKSFFEDNYIDLDAGEVKELIVRSTHTEEGLREALRLHWLGNDAPVSL